MKPCSKSSVPDGLSATRCSSGILNKASVVRESAVKPPAPSDSPSWAPWIPLRRRREIALEKNVPSGSEVNDRILRAQIRIALAELFERHRSPVDRVHLDGELSAAMDVDHPDVVDDAGLDAKAKTIRIGKPQAWHRQRSRRWTSLQR